jgi:PKD repeat protein
MYIISVTDAAGCFGTDTVIAQTGIISAAFDYNISGFEVSFTGNSTSVSSFWNFGDGNTGAGPNPTHTYSANGTYTVVHTTTTPCGVDSFSAQAVINFVNTSTQIPTQVVKVFPNPTTGRVTVDMEFPKPVNGQCMLFDILGRLVSANEVLGTEAHVSLDITSQSDGIYWLSVQTDSGLSVHKIIKQSK